MSSLVRLPEDGFDEAIKTYRRVLREKGHVLLPRVLQSAAFYIPTKDLSWQIDGWHGSGQKWGRGRSIHSLWRNHEEIYKFLDVMDVNEWDRAGYPLVEESVAERYTASLGRLESIMTGRF